LNALIFTGGASSCEPKVDWRRGSSLRAVGSAPEAALH
jgi:hypothetical protein